MITIRISPILLLYGMRLAQDRECIEVMGGVLPIALCGAMAKMSREIFQEVSHVLILPWKVVLPVNKTLC